MYLHGYIGGKHTSVDALKRSFPSHEKGNVEKSIKLLIKENRIVPHPTSYGMQYSLNHNQIGTIENILQD